MSLTLLEKRIYRVCWIKTSIGTSLEVHRLRLRVSDVGGIKIPLMLGR